MHSGKSHVRTGTHHSLSHAPKQRHFVSSCNKWYISCCCGYFTLLLAMMTLLSVWHSSTRAQICISIPFVKFFYILMIFWVCIAFASGDSVRSLLPGNYQIIKRTLSMTFMASLSVSAFVRLTIGLNHSYKIGFLFGKCLHFIVLAFVHHRADLVNAI